MPKRTLRRRMLDARSALGHDVWLASSREAQRNLLALEAYGNARVVALYAAVRNEVDTGAVLEACFRDGKRVLLPVVHDDVMVFCPVGPETVLHPGRYGIPAPCPAEGDDIAGSPDLIVVPGVVFDLHGHRIGHGKGYYDRYLHGSARTATLVGICHDFQLLEGPVPAEGHDIRMDMVVTDRRVIACR